LCFQVSHQIMVFRGFLPGSLGIACNSWSWGHEFKPHVVGCRAYFKLWFPYYYAIHLRDCCDMTCLVLLYSWISLGILMSVNSYMLRGLKINAWDFDVFTFRMFLQKAHRRFYLTSSLEICIRIRYTYTEHKSIVLKQNDVVFGVHYKFYSFNLNLISSVYFRFRCVT